jgi:hypothetical protein
VHHNNIQQVENHNTATSVRKCAVVKTNSDGSGGNVGGSVGCATGTNTAVVFFAYPGVSGYATIINDSSNYHTGFWGWLYLY